MYGIVRYKSWATLKTRTLDKYSNARWTWTPTKRGTYYLRANFAGAKLADAVLGTSSWVPTPSRVVKIVVK